MPDDIFFTLTNRLINSDKKAFDKLFRLLYAPLVKFSHKYTKDKASASDIVQDAFVNVWQIREELTFDESIKTYLFRTVRNLSLNYIRDHSYVAAGLETANLPSQNGVGVSELAEAEPAKKEAKLELVKEWISELPDRQRDVFEMSRFEGLDHEEIARVLKISKRTVNNHIVAAMKNIKRHYDNHTGMNV